MKQKVLWLKSNGLGSESKQGYETKCNNCFKMNFIDVELINICVEIKCLICNTIIWSKNENKL